MEIKLIDELTNSQIDHLFHWRERVFPIEGKEFEWAKSKWHLLALRENNEPTAHLGYADFTISLDNQSQAKVVGVGGVVVRPEDQGKNIPAKLFDFLHNSKHARSLSNIFTLFCPERLVSYYQKHSYRAFDGVVTFLQKGTSTNTKKIYSYVLWQTHIGKYNSHQ